MTSGVCPQEKHGEQPGAGSGVGVKRQSLMQGTIGVGVHRKLILRASPTNSRSEPTLITTASASVH